ncbi:MAG: DUF427 domain-containing protein [bacterium]|nr:DUF427 domain-containing protein [bacterium]
MGIWRRGGELPSKIAVEDWQESVWDYPRPPRVEHCPETRIRIYVDNICIADSKNCSRVLETSHPPVYYIPLSDLQHVQLFESDRTTWCEWKGRASYFSMLVHDTKINDAGWFYPTPKPGYEELHRKAAFYPAKMSACFVDDEQAKPQSGDFYGGWITSNIVGPFKGGAGTRGW